MSLGRYLKEMVVGEGLFVATLLTLRAVACGNVVSLSLDANLRQASHPSLVHSICKMGECMSLGRYLKEMVVGEGFEPSKSMTADLQSAPFGRSGTPPRGNALYWPASAAGSGAHHIKCRAPVKPSVSE